MKGFPGCLQDIKSPNVLLKKGDAKVADVGLSQLLSRSFANSCSFGVGTFSWAATELLLGSHPVGLPPLGPPNPPSVSCQHMMGDQSSPCGGM